jgi:hemerythrin
MSTPTGAAKEVLFPWKEAYSVKIAVIDDQHKRLIGLINSLHDALSDDAKKITAKKIFADLVSFTVTHFTTEESLMKNNGYADYADHKAEHDRLLAQLRNHQNAFEAGTAALNSSLMAFLKGWLAIHILGRDQKYSPVLRAKGVS